MTGLINHKLFDTEFEKAIRFLVKYAPMVNENTKKAMVPHDIRVGVYLFEKGYPKDIVLAGILHDTIEFTEVDEQMLIDEFGENVARLVKANSKDRSITNSDERIDELAKRCAQYGKCALIVKAADTIDSFKHYTKINNKKGLDYCIKNVQTVFKYIDKDCDDPIFDELKEWLNKTV